MSLLSDFESYVKSVTGQTLNKEQCAAALRTANGEVTKVGGLRVGDRVRRRILQDVPGEENMAYLPNRTAQARRGTVAEVFGGLQLEGDKDNPSAGHVRVHWDDDVDHGAICSHDELDHEHLPRVHRSYNSVEKVGGLRAGHRVRYVGADPVLHNAVGVVHDTSRHHQGISGNNKTDPMSGTHFVRWDHQPHLVWTHHSQDLAHEHVAHIPGQERSNRLSVEKSAGSVAAAQASNIAHEATGSVADPNIRAASASAWRTAHRAHEYSDTLSKRRLHLAASAGHHRIATQLFALGIADIARLHREAGFLHFNEHNRIQHLPNNIDPDYPHLTATTSQNGQKSVTKSAASHAAAEASNQAYEASEGYPIASDLASRALKHAHRGHEAATGADRYDGSLRACCRHIDARQQHEEERDRLIAAGLPHNDHDMAIERHSRAIDLHRAVLAAGQGSKDPDYKQHNQKAIEKKSGPSFAALGPLTRHEFGSTQFNIDNAAVLSKLKELSQSIKEEDLAEDGREDVFHITALYGLLNSVKSEDVQRIVQGFGPVRVKLGKTSVFEADKSKVKRGGSDQDVLKVDVVSPDLHRLHALLAALPHKDSFPIYKPHLTLAYLLPGEGKHYAGKTDVSGMEMSFDRLTYSPPEGKQVGISLVGNKVTKHMDTNGYQDPTFPLRGSVPADEHLDEYIEELEYRLRNALSEREEEKSTPVVVEKTMARRAALRASEKARDATHAISMSPTAPGASSLLASTRAVQYARNALGTLTNQDSAGASSSAYGEHGNAAHHHWYQAALHSGNPTLRRQHQHAEELHRQAGELHRAEHLRHSGMNPRHYNPKTPEQWANSGEGVVPGYQPLDDPEYSARYQQERDRDMPMFPGKSISKGATSHEHEASKAALYATMRTGHDGLHSQAMNAYLHSDKTNKSSLSNEERIQTHEMASHAHTGVSLDHMKEMESLAPDSEDRRFHEAAIGAHNAASDAHYDRAQKLRGSETQKSWNGVIEKATSPLGHQAHESSQRARMASEAAGNPRLASEAQHTALDAESIAESPHELPALDKVVRHIRVARQHLEHAQNHNDSSEEHVPAKHAHYQAAQHHIAAYEENLPAATKRRKRPNGSMSGWPDRVMESGGTWQASRDALASSRRVHPNTENRNIPALNSAQQAYLHAGEAGLTPISHQLAQLHFNASSRHEEAADHYAGMQGGRDVATAHRRHRLAAEMHMRAGQAVQRRLSEGRESNDGQPLIPVERRFNSPVRKSIEKTPFEKIDNEQKAQTDTEPTIDDTPDPSSSGGKSGFLDLTPFTPEQQDLLGRAYERAKYTSELITHNLESVADESTLSSIQDALEWNIEKVESYASWLKEKYGPTAAAIILATGEVLSNPSAPTLWAKLPNLALAETFLHIGSLLGPTNGVEETPAHEECVKVMEEFNSRQQREYSDYLRGLGLDSSVPVVGVDAEKVIEHPPLPDNPLRRLEKQLAFEAPASIEPVEKAQEISSPSYPVSLPVDSPSFLRNSPRQSMSGGGPGGNGDLTQHFHINLQVPKEVIMSMPAPVVHLSPSFAVQAPEMQPVFHVEAPNVTVERTEVHVHTPQQEGPLEMKIVSMPDRIKATSRDEEGNLDAVVERDVKPETELTKPIKES